MPTYQPRITDRELSNQLASIGAVVVEGPRGCGKTMSGRSFSKSEVLLDVREDLRELAKLEPATLLKQEAPLLIDEWQLEPELWNHVRRAVDERRLPGQFILTGSAVPADDITRHSGAGRFARVRMRPFSLFELGASSGEISVSALLGEEEQKCSDTDVSLQGLADHLMAGGWPGLLDAPVDTRVGLVRNYVQDVWRVDVHRVDGVKRDPIRVRRVLQSLARNVATPTKVSTLAADAGGEKPLEWETVAAYLDALERIMVLENTPAWAPSIRSRSRLRGVPKRHLVDPSIAAAALGIGSERIIRDLKYTGFLFENMAVRDLRVYTQPLGGEVFHYRDNTGLEADVIVELPDGRWSAFEVKMGYQQVEEASRSLLKLADKIDQRRHGPPVCLGVIVLKGPGYRRPDGVQVVPITAMGP